MIYEINGIATQDAFAALRDSKYMGLANIFEPQASNNFSVSFPPEFLQPEAMSKLQAAFAPLTAFGTVFDPAPFNPLAKNRVRYVKDGAVTQLNPTNFQASSGSEMDGLQVVVNHFNTAFCVTQAELSAGLRLQDLFAPSAQIHANTLVGEVMKLLTPENFDEDPIVAAAFGVSDAAAAFPRLKKSPVKNLILESSPFAAISHQGGKGFQSGEAAFGWSGIFEHGDWSLAGEKVNGFAGAPNAITIVSGFLEYFTSPLMKTSVFAIPGLKVPVHFNEWFDAGTRTQWASFDSVLGCAPADTAAGVLIKTP